MLGGEGNKVIQLLLFITGKVVFFFLLSMTRENSLVKQMVAHFLSKWKVHTWVQPAHPPLGFLRDKCAPITVVRTTVHCPQYSFYMVCTQNLHTLRISSELAIQRHLLFHSTD